MIDLGKIAEFVAEHSRLLGVTHRATTTHSSKLLEAGLRVEIPISGRVRRFIAREILAIINGETVPLDNPAKPAYRYKVRTFRSAGHFDHCPFGQCFLLLLLPSSWHIHRRSLQP
ncbi:MAG: hypothetical protein ACRDTC_26410 [Pseudonocardiaceae bacterium]